MPPVVHTHDLSRSFGDRLVVDAVTMTVPDRAVYGFVGANGSGKTTTLKMLLGLLSPSAGQIVIAGCDVTAQRIAVARQVGALLEAQGFYSNLTGAQNLNLTRRLLGLDSGEVDRTLELVDLRHAASQRVAGYSLGMRQRLGIARAMLGSPRLLILDEPTNGLDPDGIALMRGFLRDLPDRSGATVLVSSHLLSEVEHAATHVGILHQGRLVREGRLADLQADAVPVVVIDSDAASAVAVRLAALGFVAEADGDRALVRLRRGDAVPHAVAAICRALIDAQLAFTAVAPGGTSLEDLYRDVVDGALAEAA